MEPEFVDCTLYTVKDEPQEIESNAGRDNICEQGEENVLFKRELDDVVGNKQSVGENTTENSELDAFNVLDERWNQHSKVCRGVVDLENKVDMQDIPPDLQFVVKVVEGRRTYFCQLCDYNTVRVPEFNEHLVTHRDETFVSCGECNKSFSCSGKPNNPIFTTNTEKEETIVGDLCTVIITEGDDLSNRAKTLKKHMIKHTGGGVTKSKISDKSQVKTKSKPKLPRKVKSYNCTICSYKSKYSHALKQHMITHTGNGPEKCKVCGKPFISKSQLKRHELTHSAKEKTLKCSECDFTCTNSYSLKQHKITHSGNGPEKCELCDRSFISKSQLKRHELTHSTEEKPFKCSECDFTCAHSYSFKQHMITHTGNGPNKCEWCDRSFISKSQLKRHELTHFTKDKPFKCPECSFTCIYSYSLKQHLITHTGNGPNQCESCDKSFISKSQLKRHELTHSTEKPYNCTQCSFTCHYPGGIKQHMLTHVENKATIMCEICGKAFTSKGQLNRHVLTHSTADKPFKCTKCSFSCHYAYILTRHMNVHAGDGQFICKVCGKQFTARRQLSRHENLHNMEEKAFKCTECNYSFHQSYMLARHMNVHTGDGKYKCPVCEKPFSSKAQLGRHELTHTKKSYDCTECDFTTNYSNLLKFHMASHVGSGPYKCPMCDELFVSLSLLYRHKRSNHNEGKTFKCEFCSFSSRYAASLRQHVLNHTGNGPNKCDVCGKVFATKGQLSKHQLVHTQEKPCKCTLCDFTCRWSYKLKQHMKLHTGTGMFKCQFCDKTFISKGQYARHELIHTGEKPFVCTECDFACNRASILKKHMTRHTGERPEKFVCELCGKSVSGLKSLYRHRLTHMEGTPCEDKMSTQEVEGDRR